MPNISVLLCVKNAEKTIESAIRSTLVGLSSDSEVVVLDDGSTDSTLNILGSIRDKRLKIMENSSSVGPGAARAQLFEATDSAFIAIMDADDVCAPWRFRAQRALIRGLDFVFGPCIRFGDPSWSIRPSLPLAVEEETMPLLLFVGCPLVHPSMFARRDAVAEVGGYHPCLAQDYDLYLRALTGKKRMRRGALPVLAYREHKGQISRSNTYNRTIVEQQYVARAYRAFVEEEFGYHLPPIDDRLVENDVSALPSSTPRIGAVDSIGVSQAWSLIELEVARRRLSKVQAMLVRRFATIRLGRHPA